MCNTRCRTRSTCNSCRGWARLRLPGSRDTRRGGDASVNYPSRKTSPCGQKRTPRDIRSRFSSRCTPGRSSSRWNSSALAPGTRPASSARWSRSLALHRHKLQQFFSSLAQPGLCPGWNPNTDRRSWDNVVWSDGADGALRQRITARRVQIWRVWFSLKRENGDVLTDEQSHAETRCRPHRCEYGQRFGIIDSAPIW